MHKYHYVYKITNNINGKFYIGIHSTNNMDDGYMGSGVAIIDAIQKYGIQNFSKVIIDTFSNREDALKKEKLLVTEELVKSDTCYNLRTGGSSGFIYSENWLRQTSERAKKNHVININSETSRIKRAEKNRERALRGEYSTPERVNKIRTTILKQSKQISDRVKEDWNDPILTEYRKLRMRESKANAPIKTCPHCGLKMKANLTRHIKARHQ